MSGNAYHSARRFGKMKYRHFDGVLIEQHGVQHERCVGASRIVNVIGIRVVGQDERDHGADHLPGTDHLQAAPLQQQLCAFDNQLSVTLHMISKIT